MRAWVLRALRAEARAWWRPRGPCGPWAVEEAVLRERASIRFHLGVIHKALATPGAHMEGRPGGVDIHFGPGTTLSGGPLERMAAARVLLAMGLPLIDTTTAPHPWRARALPLVAVGETPDEAPWHDFSRVPLAVYAARARMLGATVRNLPPEAQCGAGARRGG